MAKEEDGILIKKIISGDRKAQEELYNRYKKIVTKQIVNKYPFNRDTDDDVSEVLIRVFEKLKSYDETKAKFITWVLNITENYMIDKSRSSSFQLNNNSSTYMTLDDGAITLTSSSSPKCFYSTSITPDLNFENEDALDFIYDKIGIQDFHLLNMKYGEGYDYKDMEKEMGVSSTTISNRVNYVKSKLKRGK
jgi:RNA polymerase sigma-70 factor (ECF subfamily)